MSELTQQSILVVEDEVLIAMELEGVLVDAGCHVRTATSVAGALTLLAEGHLDAAVLDVNVNGETIFPVADALAEVAVPYVLLTGHSAAAMPERQRERPILVKPYDPKDLIKLLAGIIAAGRATAATCRRS